MDNSTMSPADIAALQNNGMNNQGSWIWFLLIFVLLGWGGGYGGGRGNGGPAVIESPNYVTQAEFTSGLNNQATQAQLQQMMLANQQNAYNTAQLINNQTYQTGELINNQTNSMLQQNNTNLINAIQGFNNLSQQVSAQTNTLSSKLDQLGYQMEQCCCSVKTQMLNDRLEDRNRELSVAQNALSNAQQTQNILAATGRWVGWAGSGTQTAGVVSAS